MEITLENYCHCSFGNFTPCKEPKNKPTYVSEASVYWHTKENGEICVIRKSNHWGKVANSFWKINGKSPRGNFISGKIKLKDLKYNHKGIKHLKKLLKKLPFETLNEIFKEFGR